MNIIERLNCRRAEYITRHGTAPRTCLLLPEEWGELQAWCAANGIQQRRTPSKNRGGIWLFGMQCRLASEAPAPSPLSPLEGWEAPQEWGDGASPERAGYQQRRTPSKNRGGIWLLTLAPLPIPPLGWWEEPQEWGDSAPPENGGYQIDAGYVLPGTALPEGTTWVPCTEPVDGSLVNGVLSRFWGFDMLDASED